MRFFGICAFVLSFIACVQLTAPYRSLGLLRSNVASPASGGQLPLPSIPAAAPAVNDELRRALRQISAGSEQFSIEFIRVSAQLGQ